MNTSQTTVRGNIGVSAVIRRALELGYHVSIPFEGANYDLVLDDGMKLERIQVKYTTPVKDRLRVQFDTTNGNGTAQYSKDNIDALIIFDPVHDQFYKVPIEYRKRKSMSIRLPGIQSKNNQVYATHPAEQFVWARSSTGE